MSYIYIAGSLFSEAEQKQRIEEERLIEEGLVAAGVYGVDIFNPITNPFNDKSTLPTAEDIFLGDTVAIRESSHILLNLDNQLDAGVFVELGQIVGLMPDSHHSHPTPQARPSTGTKMEDNFMGDPSSKVFITSKQQLEQSAIKFPTKRKIYPVISDLRVGSADQYSKERIPWGINTYVIGALYTYDPDIVFYPSADAAIKQMVLDLK